ncbi:MAG: chemotaxis protein CheW [Candidatus Competibacteraceae bacterium]|nr:chemotaxis protein CheW [Candidatus Competibacteraceae bacterium]MBK7983151.1 chemotaxis protein CheW [Candidatus Competibacteraceae bacterium]MBK8898302.1 chemotaxis protein CheW [Candidatus Competibacteraceae bacterium]MBK8962108.1 chemotaxis protein CheW [Candidatus Competibacteraceae bacterium]MBK9951321.1 chemotaxis protein CheW [Candidatus Competibacteraceae bacterium]
MNRPLPTTLAELQEIQLLSLVTVDGHHWLLPQAEIRLLGPLLDIDQELTTPCSIGAVGFEGEWWPVYCLSGELRPLAQLTANRRICLLLSNGSDNFGLVCDQVEPLRAIVRFAPLPACMMPPDSPIQAITLLEGKIACVTTTEHLAAFIAALEEEHDNAT